MENQAATSLERLGFVARAPRVFDHQVTGTYGECERMCYYLHVLGRMKQWDDRYALLWGKVFHAITEHWQKNEGDLEGVINIIEANIPEDVDDRYGRTQRRMQEAFIEWVKKQQSDPLEVIQAEQAVAITCDGPCPYFDTAKGCDLTYGGRMDRIVRWNAMVGPLDIKTTVMNYNDPASMFRPGHQMEGYVWCASHLIGKHCWGAIIEQAVINKSRLDIKRFPVPFAEDNIREWAQTERLYQAEIRQKVKDHPYDELFWKQNKGRCWDPYPCAFREVCLSSRDMDFRHAWLKTNTVERRWDFTDPDKRPEASNG